MANNEHESATQPESSYEASEYNIPAMVDSDSDCNEDNGAWCFETLHAVLKNNPDYINLMRTLTILHAQKVQTIKDMESLGKIKEKALEDPVSFVQRLKRGEDVGLPAPLKVAEVPTVDWERYNPGAHKDVRPRSPFASDVYFQDELGSDLTRVKMEDSDDEPRPDTHNQPWTVEEQARLDQLLLEFPQEEVDSNRHRKIAAALGNRTAKQVTSRIQKYFVKLRQSGLSIPGRAPRTNSFSGWTSRNRRRHRHQKFNHYLSRRSSFFPGRTEHDPGNCSYLDEVNEPLVLDAQAEGLEDEDREQEEKETDESEDDATMNIGKKVEEMNATRLLDLLRRVMQERRRGKSNVRHGGFKCDTCKEEPIIGTRWHCKTCVRISVDFCSECVVTQAESPSRHPLGHNLQPISRAADSTPRNTQDFAQRVFDQRKRKHNLVPNI